MNEILNFLNTHSLATESQYHYAEFSHQLELIYMQNKNDLPSEMASQLDSLIFDVEVINALSLTDWDLAGKPHNWGDWNAEYKNDADNLVSQLRNILEGVQNGYIKLD